MKEKRYWLRGLGIGCLGLVAYGLLMVALVYLFFSGVIHCNAFDSFALPGQKESLLCGPVITAAMPFLIISELAEDIAGGTSTHTGWYIGLIAVLAIYFSAFAFLGRLYGKRKQRLHQ